jgi:hypothetical protein
MISISDNISNMLGRPARRIQARVEQYECSALQNGEYNRVLLNTFYGDGALQEFKVERTADDGKFFGFGICQKLTVKLRDKDRAINILKDQALEISFGVENDYTYPCPMFRVEEVSRDENSNDLTITAYDFLYVAGEHRVSELEITDYTIRSFVLAAAALINLPVKFDIDEPAFDLHFPTGANFDGSETLRTALNAVAEATQTIYFVDWDWRLTFTRLDKNADPVLTIDKSKYFELQNKSDRTLTTICHATELGDNVEATTGAPGVTQYVRNNPFWDLREDVDVLISNALAAISGITISQFDCSWRGNFALEIGDKINIHTKNDEVLVGYVLNDTLIYNGGLKEQTFWNFTEHAAESASNPITLGEALKQTYARVDKANKTIELYVSETDSKLDGMNQTINEKSAEIKLTTDAITQRVEATETSIGELGTTVNNKFAEVQITTDGITNRVESTESRLDTNDGEMEVVKENISTLQQTSDSISAQVSSVETITSTNREELEAAIADLDEKYIEELENIDVALINIQKSVDVKMTSEDLTIQINQALEAGTTRVETTTGFVFDEDGLNISKTGSEMATQITEDGMTVYRGSEGVLIANNEGVKAEDLQATTYLIIGGRSRFENFEREGSPRTGCFWIG